MRLITSAQTFGAVIRDERKKKGMTQVELGKRTGLEQSTISLVEKGKSTVQLQTILVLLAALNLNLLIEPRSQGEITNEDRW